MTKKELTWILVANGAQARLFKLINFPKLQELNALAHPSSRLHDQDLVSDRPGRTFDRTGTGRHAYVPETDPKQVEIEKFAKEVGAYLNTHRREGEFSRLYVIAAPAFLGLLRGQLDAETQNVVVAEVAKDMILHPQADIEHQLSQI